MQIHFILIFLLPVEKSFLVQSFTDTIYLSLPTLFGSSVPISQLTQAEYLVSCALQGHYNSNVFQKLTNTLGIPSASVQTLSSVVVPCDFPYFQINSARNLNVCMLYFTQNICMFYFRRNFQALYLPEIL